jgi:cobalt/nickel transport system permease protein
MHHSFLDRYSDLSSPVHRWDARLKLIISVVLVICIVTVPQGKFMVLATFLLLLLGCWIAARLPLIFLLKRLAVLVPFVLVMSATLVWAHGSSTGKGAVEMLGHITLRASAAIMAISLLVSTTPFPSLLCALQWMRTPAIIISLMAFLYRFAYILVDEFERLGTGRKSREFTRSLILAWRSRAWMLGTFLLRSIERSERVYQAMAARGFSGQMVIRGGHAATPTREIMFSALAAAVIIFIRIEA